MRKFPSLSGVDNPEGAIGNLRLEDVPCTLEEQEGVVVGQGTSIEVQRIVLAFNVVYQVLTHGFTNGNAVKCDIVVNSVCVGDQAVVGDYSNAFISCHFHSDASGSCIMGTDDDNLCAPSDEGLHIGLLCSR